MPDLSVVIPTLGSYETLERVLDGFERQSVPVDAFEVLVVMDFAEPDPDAVTSAIGSRQFAVERVQGEVAGASGNRNAGWRAASAPIVVFTDNDTIPVRRFLAEHLSWHRRHPEEEVGVLGRVRWSREIEVTTFMRWLDTGAQFDYAKIRGVDAGWGRFYSANSSLKRSFVARVGGFDDQRFPYGYEDTEWAYRASKLGFRLLYNRRAVVDHLRPMTLEFWKKRVRRVAASERRFHELYPELPPWFHRIYSEAAAEPPVRGRGVRLARWVPPWVPWLGPRVWGSVDKTYKQALAPHFLEAWEAASSGGSEPGPNLSEWDAEQRGATGR